LRVMPKIANAAFKANKLTKAWNFEAKTTGPEGKAIKIWPRGQGQA